MRANISAAVALIAAILIGATVQEAGAWCWLRDTGKVPCDEGGMQHSCCSGNLRTWPDGTMIYYISTSTPEDLRDDIRAGFQRWTDVAMSHFSFVDGGTTSTATSGNDGTNIATIDALYCTNRGNCGEGILGSSSCFSNGVGTSSYHTVDCDILFNGEEFSWGDGTSGTINTIAVMAHESGHDAGLSHPGSECRVSSSCGCGAEVPAATMYWNYSGGQPTDKTSLELDEIAALVYGYPRNTFRVRVLDQNGIGIAGASVNLIGTSAPVNGTDIATGGRVLGDVSNEHLLGDKASSETYISSTPFNATDASGYTNYVHPVHQAFSISVTYDGQTVTQPISLDASGTSSISVIFSSAKPDILAAGVSHSIFIQNDGSLWAWGWNEHGQLGDGTTTERYSPVRIGADSDWKAVAAGGGVSSGMGHTVALKEDGSLWAWGDNAAGQLGDGTTVEKHSPIRIGADSDWKAVTAAGGHTVALKEDGSLWAWGWNGNGQLGDGTTTDRHSPVRIGTDSDWKAVIAGMYHTVALKDNGSIWSWGYNYFGQLGDGTTTSRIIPGPTGTDGDWRNIFHGGGFTLALKNEASLWSWGNNGYGQLGNNTTEHQYSPVQVGSDNHWQVADGGGAHVIALKTDGSLWSWGYNANGQLGDGTTEDKHIPMQVGASSNWKAVAAGNAYSMALKQDGSLWAWGDNGHGQLGDSTMTNRHAPVQVVFLSDSDTDSDGIDDGWEMTYFHDLTTASSTRDYDKDGYSDLQEYLNWLAHESDPDGAVYNPTKKNAAEGTGYVEPRSSALQAVLNLLL